jgi:hypothetical protein
MGLAGWRWSLELDVLIGLGGVRNDRARCPGHYTDGARRGAVTGGWGHVFANSCPLPPGWEARLYGRQGCLPLQGLSDLIRPNPTKKIQFGRHVKG